MENQFVRNLVEPCWWMKFNEAGENEAQVLIEVHDFIVSAQPEIKQQIKDMLHSRFDFGKWEDGAAEYAGLSAVYKINWVETRPEMSGLASIMASKLKNAVIEDITVINKNINFLRSTASRPLTLWKVNPADSAFIAVSDAGGVGVKHEVLDEDGLPKRITLKGAWIVLIAEVFSTFGGETQAMLQGISEVDWIQIMIRVATAHDVELRAWRNSLSPHMLIMRSDCEVRLRQPQCAGTDAKSLYDCLLKEHPPGKQDRGSSLLAIIVKDLQETRSSVWWVPHQKMLADAMTKPDSQKASGALEQMLKTGIFSLVDVSEELANSASDSRTSQGIALAKGIANIREAEHMTKA
ncbi:unnamed protein product, partial [Symbiodinium sp. KB8]